MTSAAVTFLEPMNGSHHVKDLICITHWFPMETLRTTPISQIKKKTKAYTYRRFGRDHEWWQIRARLLNTNLGWTPSAAWTLTNSSPATSSNHTPTPFPGILHHWPYLLLNTKWRGISLQIQPCSTSHYETNPLSAGLSSHPERVPLVFLSAPTSLLLLPALSDFPAQIVLSLLDHKASIASSLLDPSWRLETCFCLSSTQ